MALDAGTAEVPTCSPEPPGLRDPPESDSEILTEEHSQEVTMSSEQTPRAGEIHLASPDVTPKSGEACSVRRSNTLDSCASPEATSGTEANDFCIVSADGRTFSEEHETGCPSEDLEIASSESPQPDLEEEMPLHFMSRLDAKEHWGQLIRNVELLGRRYLVVRTEPSEEDSHQGLRSIIHVFGLGYLNAHHDDIVMLDRPSKVGDDGDHSEDGEVEDLKLSKAQGRTVEEPGLFVPDTSRFRQKELLGSGGFADVYRYEQLDADGRGVESYAVKEVDLQILSSRVGTDQERLVRWVARLEFEVRNLMKLRGHPGVVKVQDAFAYRRKFYIVMEYVNGTDLGRRLKGRGRLSEMEARGLFAQMAEALRHSHALDVVHRDFKPHNILLASPLRPGQPDVVKLVDFGLSKDISGCSSGTSTPFLGTKYYRAPETRHTLPGQENYDAAKVDVFALGVTLYVMLAGSHPQEGEEVNELTLRGAAWQRVSNEARDLLLGLLKHEPEQRLSLDDVIEHPWLSAIWASGEPEDQDEAPVEEPEEAEEIGSAMPLGPSFMAAFPEAPASSCAAKIPAEGGSSHGSPVQSASAPGWGNVLSWLHADAASAEARQVLSHVGAPAAPTVAFGRAPLMTPGKRNETEKGDKRAALHDSEDATGAVTDLPDSGTDLAAEQPAEGSKEGVTAEAAAAPGRIKWISCAPRFASVWRFAQATADSPAPSLPSPAPSPAPSLPPSPSPSPPQLGDREGDSRASRRDGNTSVAPSSTSMAASWRQWCPWQVPRTCQGSP